jgi:hypothetical protein
MSDRDSKSFKKQTPVTATALPANHVESSRIDTNTSGSATSFVAWDADLQVANAYSQTAQTREGVLVDYHARAALEEVKSRLNILEAKVGEMGAAVEGLGTKLDHLSGSPQESISRTLLGLLRNVGPLRAAYLSPTSDGYQVILTYPDSTPLVDFLRAVVPIEIEIDKRYKNVYFDFEHVPESDFSIRSFPDAKLLQ